MSKRSGLETLTRQARLGAPLLAQLHRAFDAENSVDPLRIGTLYEAQLSQEKARAQGSFYTPPFLVDFVVQHTLTPLVKGLEPVQIERLRILDPSCGGGAFLLGVLRFLEAQCIAGGANAGVALRTRLSRCLVGVDLDADAIEVTRASLLLAVGGASKMTLICGDALLPTTNISKVDAIVGNPPWGQKNLKLGAATRKRYKELFVTAKGVWDPFKFFVERVHQLLPASGYWGFVLPDIVLLKNLQEVRDVILQGSAIREIAHCGKAFPGANIDAIALCAQRVHRPVGAQHLLQVWPKLRQGWQNNSQNSGSEDSYSQKQAVFNELPGHKFNLYLHGPALDLYRRLRKHPRLGEHFEMHEGVHSGNSRTRLFMESKGPGLARRLIVGGSEMAAYSLQWKGRWLNTDPNAIDRKAGQYANLGRPHWHGRNKLVVRRTGDRVMAAFDSQGFYVSNNLFVLLDKTVAVDAKSTKQFRLAIVALLNSRFMTWYFRAIQPRRGRLFAELKLNHMCDFPLPTLKRWRGVEAKLAALAIVAQRKGAHIVASEVNTLVESAFEISPPEQEVIGGFG